MTESKSYFTMTEGTIDFQFFAQYFSFVIKFDDDKFYREKFNKMPYSKGVDFFALGKNCIVLLEVKDCYGKESENRWRIFPDNKKRDTSPTPVDTTDRDSLDIEISKKVAMTLACLVGAYTNKESNLSDAMKLFLPFLKKKDVPEISVILFLEGDFSSHSKTQKMIMNDLQNELKKKLSWLKCKVLVENLTTQKERYFKAQRTH